MSEPATLVTGANGFIASEIVYALLQEGKNVLASVRSESRTSELRQAFAKEVESGQLKFAFCSFDDKESIENIFKVHGEITSVIHTANAMNFADKDLMENMVKPVIAGMNYMLNAVKEYAPQVKRFVYSSSVASIYGGPNEDNPYFHFTPDVWNPVELTDPITKTMVAYSMSKKFSEKTAWDFVQNNEVKFNLKTIIVPTIFGAQRIPPKTRKDFNGSNSWAIDAFDGKGLPTVRRPGGAVYADVKTIAAVHVQASDATQSPPGHRRYLAYNETFSFPSLYALLHTLYPDEGVYVPKPEEFPVHLYTYDRSLAEKELKIPHYTLEQSMKELVSQFFAMSEEARSVRNENVM
jgi:NADPH-dependent methylglyoxal reductase